MAAMACSEVRVEDWACAAPVAAARRLAATAAFTIKDMRDIESS
jgi:hypothetical protein